MDRLRPPRCRTFKGEPHVPHPREQICGGADTSCSEADLEKATKGKGGVEADVTLDGGVATTITG